MKTLLTIAVTAAIAVAVTLAITHLSHSGPVLYPVNSPGWYDGGSVARWCNGGQNFAGGCPAVGFDCNGIAVDTKDHELDGNGNVTTHQPYPCS